jgi:hypothetical protein
MAKINSLFFKKHKKSITDYSDVKENLVPIKSISWFLKMARKESASLEEINDSLKEIEKFIDKKELEKE